jgi:beta-galactosidase
VRRVTQTGTIATPRLWDGKADPYLYRVWAEVGNGPQLAQICDLVEQPLGFRFFAIDPATGFSLNGRSYPLRGVAMHQDWQDLGWATRHAEQVRNVELLNELGANFVRLAHYQHPQETYDLLDRSGIVAWTEIPLVNTTSNAAPIYANLRQQLTELILQNFNHPSIVVWGLHNELRADPTPSGETKPTLTLLNTLAHSLDPSRPTTVAAHENTTPSSSLAQTSDLVGWNYYLGWYSGTRAGFGPACDSFHTTYPNRCFSISEYGAGGSIIQHQENPNGADPYGRFHPEEYESIFHESYWQQISARPYLWCTAVWNMFDFAVDGRRDGDTHGRNDKGLVTYDRATRKDAFYFYQAQWTTTPMVHLCSQRFTPRTTTPIEIKVYSNCAAVELLQNGVSLGTKTSTDRIFRWTGVNLALGGNDFKAVGTAGATTVSDHFVNTFTPPASTVPIALAITPDAAGFRLSFPSAPGQHYQVESTTALATGVWLPLTEVIDGDGTEMVIVDPAGSAPARFYRVRILP